MTATARPVAVLDAHIRCRTVDTPLVLDLPRPSVTALFGPSGAGKTTVLRVLAGLDRTVGGHVRLDGEQWDDGRRRQVPVRRRGVGYLVQDHALFPHLDVLANVAYGLGGLPRSHRGPVAREALDAVGAGHLASRRVPGLSGGEAQRVALARALAPSPRLLLLDEPLSALDAPLRARLQQDLRAAVTARGVPTLVVTHDRAEALALADQVVVVVDGAVRQVGSPTEVFDRPADPGVAAVVGVETAVRGRATAAQDGLTRVTVGQRTLVAVTDLAAGATDVLVCIRAQDVALEAAGPLPAASARNRLPATVTALRLDGALVRVDLDAGFGLTAFVTRPAVEDLGLTPGRSVTAVVKAQAVHLVPHPAT
jgi:molybdate transport system ATP-binding protein